MKDKAFKPYLALAMLVVLGLACGFNISTANIADAYMAFDEDGAQATTVYASDDTFYAIVELANAPDDTEIRAEWFVVNAEGVEPNTFLGDYTLVFGDGTLTFSYAPGEPWSPGTYRVDLYLNDELATSLEFQVQ